MKWHLECIKISTLKKHPHNPRRLSKKQAEQLTTSLQAFGMVDKPIVNLDGMIIGGHQRIAIWKKLGNKEIECWVPDRQLKQEEVDEFNIRLNKNTGEWDFDTLANEWEMEDLRSWGFDVVEFGMATTEEIEAEEKEQKKKKTTHCPACGHDF